MLVRPALCRGACIYSNCVTDHFVATAPAEPLRQAAFSECVVDVVIVGSEEKMVRAHAKRVVAAMADVEPASNRTYGQ